MKRNSVRLKILSALVFCVLICSCTKKPDGTTGAPAAPTPEPKMEGQSAKWKVAVSSVDKVPRQESYDPMGSQDDPSTRMDTLQLSVEFSYIGPPADVQSPEVSLIDSKGQKIAALKAALELPGAIYTISFGPGYSSLRAIFTGEGTGNENSTERDKAEKDKMAKEILNWLDPEATATYMKKPRSLKTGEKFKTIYFFADPKEYKNIQFVFSDVPAIAVNNPKGQTQPTPQPSQSPPTSTSPLESKGEGQSSTWKAVVTRIEQKPNDTTDPSNPRDSLEISLELEYIGPARQVGPPSASLIDGKGVKYSGDINSTTIMRWVLPEGSPQVGLKAGTKLSVGYTFKDPKDSNLKLAFADVPPITLKN